MTEEEAKQIFDELRADGDTDEIILTKLYILFTEDFLTLEQFGCLVDILGYELREDFLKLSPEEQKTVALPDNYGADKTEEKVS